MSVLIIGGAGYIGSHAVAALLARGEDVVVLDNLYQGHKAAVLGGKLIVGDIRDSAVLDDVFQNHQIDSVIHFAANSLVGESMTDPGKYYNNNVYGTLCLLEKMKEYNVKRIVFSSTAACYGEPEEIPITESSRTLPTNAYGQTKLAMEQMMKWFDHAYGIKWISLRYFNAAGALADARIGEDHSPESHLIPLILQVALNQRAHISVFGDDYPTADGTCIRDYIHVSDLADAHVLAVDKLREGADSNIYNLGNGEGFSVLEVIEQVRAVTGHAIPVKMEGRRAGDPAILIASSERARNELGWKPSRNNLRVIIEDAWRWHSNHPKGYNDSL
ncbi:MAG: UDP-glucose 4-epimerase GalE [Bacillota bacterium]|jgi:UDP-glucose 4-epimerase